MGFIEQIENYLKGFLAIDLDAAWFAAVDQEVQKLIIDLNTKNQLGEEGIDADGANLGEYAPMTIEERTGRGLQVDHIDFKFTGWYWTTFEVVVNDNGFEVVSDRERYNELVRDLRFSPTHTGLTAENEQKVFELIRIKFLDVIYAAL